jgi:hypothetical protein
MMNGRDAWGGRDRMVRNDGDLIGDVDDRALAVTFSPPPPCAPWLLD